MNSIRVSFPCGNITLEGDWHFPEGNELFPSVIVCHPHPLYGGNMRNNVVTAICEALSRHSVATFRFNFRGVGGSEGNYGEGITEQEDVKAALDFVVSSPNTDSEKIGLAGYSFGARVALSAAFQDERVSLLALVSPPLSDEAIWNQLRKYPNPKLLVVGDADPHFSLDSFQRLGKDFSRPGQYQVVSGADHFWRGYEEEMAQRVSRFFVSGFKK
ncbi:MAG: alpha/beta hydrolase [Dehalococcoidales bacterium]|nr:alpha/beta hydrolase [Dehalococcoidales bacterium]